MVLFDLFLKNNINFSVASCNFQLRGKDSDNDLKFVENICIKNNINFYSTVLEVDKFSTMRKISTQMAARELRYNFFKKTLEKYKYSYIATAHHLDDNIETDDVADTDPKPSEKLNYKVSGGLQYGLSLKYNIFK